MLEKLLLSFVSEFHQWLRSYASRKNVYCNSLTVDAIKVILADSEKQPCADVLHFTVGKCFCDQYKLSISVLGKSRFALLDNT